jgi:hypothetical protein
MKETKFEDLVGKTLTQIIVSPDRDLITFTDDNGDKYEMYHSQDCCESVSVEDIVGDLNDLLNTPILAAAESSSSSDYDESSTWTFYNLATIKGYVTIRWYGNSNGYYSESVDFVKTTQP